MKNKDQIFEKDHQHFLLWLSLFAVAIAFIESIVAIYLREIYYPEGFDFPYKKISTFTMLVEQGRELATIVMLVAVAVITGKRPEQRLVTFCYLLGLWDIFYYVWLKVLINWPESIFEWDILFLIPIPWAAPVLIPVLVSLGLIVGSLRIFSSYRRGRPIIFAQWEWCVLLFLSAVIILTFLWNTPSLIKYRVPKRYPWEIFALAVAIVGIWLSFRRKIHSGKE